MNTSLIGSEAVELLSNLTRLWLDRENLSPPVIFIAALISVLRQVMFADGTVTDTEKRHWNETLNRFIVSEDVRQITPLISMGMKNHPVSANSRDFLTLTAPLSKPERLLLIGFAYEMSMVDGNIDNSERQRLEEIANKLEINPQHSAVLEAGFSGQGTFELTALDEVMFLLDPVQFDELDSVFARAASEMLTFLPARPNNDTAYKQLKEFQNAKKQLNYLCDQIIQITKDCNYRDVLPCTLIDETDRISKKIQSQRFRVAVVGEFSRGKSTLINALLGEQIQPVRAIPCSGTLTVLKYGVRKRVICRYRDGREEEISIADYQERATISTNAALGNCIDELATSEIDELIFEHPALDLCGNGVEIIDTPGLNEHPCRTTITKKLLMNADAIIFLTHAQQSLNEGELNLLQELKTQLNVSKVNEAVANIFIVVNFWDFVDNDTDSQEIKQRVNHILQGHNQIIRGENRIHFISSKAALDAILNNNEDSYLKSFRHFTQSLESFLTLERGHLEIQRSVLRLDGLIQSGTNGLHQAERFLNGQLNFSDEEKNKILEKMGEISGQDFRILSMARELKKQAVKQAIESWQQWQESLRDRLVERSEKWNSQYSPLWNREKLIKSYTGQFVQDLQNELCDWANFNFKNNVLIPNLTILDKNIYKEIKLIEGRIKIFERETNTNLIKQLKLDFSEIDIKAFIEGRITNSLLGGIGLVFTGLMLSGVPLLIMGLPLILNGIQDSGHRARAKILDVGLQKLTDITEGDISIMLNKVIDSAFNIRLEASKKAIKQIMFSYENILKQQEKAHKETLEQRQAEKAFINQKRQELEQLQKNLKTIIPA